MLIKCIVGSTKLTILSFYLPWKRKTVEMFFTVFASSPIDTRPRQSVSFLPTHVWNKETQCRNAFRARFYGLLQIPLEDFTSNVRRRWKRKRQACRGGVNNRRFQYLESKKASAPLPRDGSYGSKACDIYFPSTKRRNATRTAIRC